MKVGLCAFASLRGQPQRDESTPASFAFAADEPSSKTKIDLLERDELDWHLSQDYT